MSKSSKLLSHMAIAFCIAIAGSSFIQAYTTDTNVYAPPQYTTFIPPAAGGSYTDPVFGTAIKRLTDVTKLTRLDTGGALPWVSPEYSTMSPFNKDNTRLLLTHFSYFGLYDGSGNYLRDLLSAGVSAASQPRWSKSDANVFYFISGNALKSYNVGTNVSTTLRTFSEYSAINGMGESDISEDGLHMVFAGDSRYVFIYNLATNTKSPVFDTSGHGFDSLYMTPDNHVTITWYANGTSRYNGIEMFDGNMNFLRQVAPVGGHMDVTRDTNGDEVLVWVNAADPHPICQNGIVKIRLADASQKCLITFDWSVAMHVTAPDQAGWAIVETYAPSDPIPPNGWVTYTDEFIQVKLDGSENRRIAHHRSRPMNSYTYQPKISVSGDGTKAVFGSNFGLQAILAYPTEYQDTYMIDLAVMSPNMTAPASGGSSSGSTGGGSTSGPTTTRVEQNNSAVTYSGNWNNNSNSVLSGGSAVLAMDTGSRANFSFNGTGASWIGYADEWSGIAKVYVDGTLKTTVDTYKTPYSPQYKQYSVTDLPSGAHTLTVEVTGTKNASSAGYWVWVDAFDVISGSGTSSSGSGTTTPPPTTTTTVTRIEQNGDGVSYSGGGTWYPNTNTQHSGGTAVLANSPSARVTFTFSGTAANWIGYSDEWCGTANVYVDGVLKTTLDTYKSPMVFQSKQYSVSGLAPGTHTLTIQPTGKRGTSSKGSWVWIDAFEVVSSNTTTAAPAAAAPAPAPTAAPEPAPTPSPTPSPTPVASTATRVEQNAAGIAYSGNWVNNSNVVHSGGSAVLAMDTGSRAVFAFSGTGANWIGYADEWSGIANVYVDGVLKTTVDTYRTPFKPQALQYSVSGLSPGSHTLMIEVTGTKNPASAGFWIWIDAFEVIN